MVGRRFESAHLHWIKSRPIRAGFFYPVEISITPCTPSRGICGAPWAPVASGNLLRDPHYIRNSINSLGVMHSNRASGYAVLNCEGAATRLPAFLFISNPVITPSSGITLLANVDFPTYLGPIMVTAFFFERAMFILSSMVLVIMASLFLVLSKYIYIP